MCVCVCARVKNEMGGEREMTKRWGERDSGTHICYRDGKRIRERSFMI